MIGGNKSFCLLSLMKNRAMSNKFKNMVKNKFFMLAMSFLLTANLCLAQETASISKWRFGTSVSGGYTFAHNNSNDYVNCNWELDLYRDKLQTSFYSRAGWNETDNMFDFGLKAGYSIVDGNVLQVTPMIGFGLMSSNYNSNMKNIITPSVGANLDFKLWTNKKSKRNDIWMIRLQYNCSLPLTNEKVVGIHNISIGVAVNGVLSSINN